MEKLVSIIILNYNSNLLTIECLKSLKNQNYINFEILLVDNGSTNENFLNLIEKLDQFKSNLKINLIRSKKNLFFAGGANKAIKMAKGDYICLLNNDAEVMPDFIEKMVDFLEENPQAGMITPKIKFHPETDYIWSTGGIVSMGSADVGTIRGFLKYDPDNQKYNEIETTDFAPGTALFVKKKYLKKIGLIDEVYLMYWEDPDWNFRAKKIGYESYYVPTTIVYHKVPIDHSRYFKKKSWFDFFFIRNRQLLMWKFATLKELLIFYRNFIHDFVSELREDLKKKDFWNINLKMHSLLKGFKIGLRRRFHRSCKKSMLKDYKYAKKKFPHF